MPPTSYAPAGTGRGAARAGDIGFLTIDFPRWDARRMM
jgi:hypothetical protein